MLVFLHSPHSVSKTQRYCLLERKHKLSWTTNCASHLFLILLIVLHWCLLVLTYIINGKPWSLLFMRWLSRGSLYLFTNRPENKDCYLRGVTPCSQVQLHGPFRAGLVNVRPSVTSKFSRIQFNKHNIVCLQNVISLIEWESGTTLKFPIF